MFCMLYTNELAVSLLADLQCRSPVSVFTSHTCTTFPFCTVKLNNNNNNNNNNTISIYTFVRNALGM